MNKNLSIIKPTFLINNSKKKFDYIKFLYKNCPIYPYFFGLNDNNIATFGFDLIKESNGILQTLSSSNESYSKIFIKYKIGNDFLYSTIKVSKDYLKYGRNIIKPFNISNADYL